MEACFCVEVITVNTCSLLSLIGPQLVLTVCEGGLLLSPAEEFAVSGNSGEGNTMKRSSHSAVKCSMSCVARGL